MLRNGNADATVPTLDEALRSVGFIGVWTWEIASGMMVFDKAMAMLLFGDASFAGKALPGRETQTRIHPDDRSWLSMKVTDAVRSAGPVDVEYRVQEPDGSERRVRVIGHVFGPVDGEPVGVRGIALSPPEAASEPHREAAAKDDMLAACVDRLLEARKLTEFGLLTKLIDMALLEAGRRLADGLARQRREAMT